MSADTADQVFDNVQIGRGPRVLAQHGSVVVGADGTCRLLGTSGEVIASAPVADVSAKRMVISAGRSVSVRIQGHRYSVTPWWSWSRARQLTTALNAPGRAT